MTMSSLTTSNTHHSSQKLKTQLWLELLLSSRSIREKSIAIVKNVAFVEVGATEHNQVHLERRMDAQKFTLHLERWFSQDHDACNIFFSQITGTQISYFFGSPKLHSKDISIIAFSRLIGSKNSECFLFQTRHFIYHKITISSNLAKEFRWRSFKEVAEISSDVVQESDAAKDDAIPHFSRSTTSDVLDVLPSCLLQQKLWWPCWCQQAK